MNIKKQRPVLVMEQGGKKTVKEVKQTKITKRIRGKSMFMFEHLKPAKPHWFPVTTPNEKTGEILYCCSECRAFASITDNCKQARCGNCGVKMNIKE